MDTSWKPPTFSPAPLSFANSELVYVNERLFGPNTMITGTSFMVDTYFPYPLRESIKRTLEWVNNQSSETLELIASWIQERESKENILKRDEDGNEIQHACQDFWKNISSSSPSSSSAVPPPGAQELKANISSILHDFQRSPYYTFHVKTKKWLSLLYSELVRHMDILHMEYTNRNNEQEITEMELRNLYQDVLREGGLHVLWRKLELYHPLDIFSTMFLQNDLRRDVKIFLMLMIMRTVDIYNREVSTTTTTTTTSTTPDYPSYLHLQDTLPGMMSQVQVVFPAMIVFQLPTNNRLFSDIFRSQVYDWCVDVCEMYHHHVESTEPAYSAKQVKVQAGYQYIHYLPFEQVIGIQ